MYARVSFTKLLLVFTGEDPNMGSMHVLLNLWVGSSARARLRTGRTPGSSPLCGARPSGARPPGLVVHVGAGPGQIGWIARPSLDDIEPVLVPSPAAVVSCCSRCSLPAATRPWPLFGRAAGGARGSVAAWLIVPVVLSFAVSFVQPMFVSYYLIICIPALVLFGAAAIARLRRPLVAGALVAPLVWLSATYLLPFYARDSVENWRDPTRYVLAATRAGDGIVFFPDGGRKPFGVLRASGRGCGASEPRAAAARGEGTDLARHQGVGRCGRSSGNRTDPIVADGALSAC